MPPLFNFFLSSLSPEFLLVDSGSRNVIPEIDPSALVRTTNQKAGDGTQKSAPLTRLQVVLYWNQLAPGSLYLPQICIQRFYVGSLKLVALGIFTPQTLAHTMNQNFLF